MNDDDEYAKCYMKDDGNWGWKGYEKIYWHECIDEI